MKNSTKITLGIASALTIATIIICSILVFNTLNKQDDTPIFDETASAPVIIDFSKRPTYDNRTEFNQDEIGSGGYLLNIVGSDYKIPAKLQEASAAVAIVFIDSIDGATNYAKAADHSTAIVSFGKMTILESFKGNLEPGSTKTFYRYGGVMDFDQYCEHANQAHCDKLRHLKPDRSTIAEFSIQDPDFEVGKVYLGYFIKDRDFSEEEGYTFTGLEGGTREVQTERTYTLGSDSSNLQVLNNFTGEWEHLGNIIK